MLDLALTDRVAIVTGASSGIGRVCARTLGEQGARVVAVARRADLLQSLADEMVGAGLRPPGTITTDVTDEAAASTIVEHAVGLFGGVDILVNAAGGSRTLPRNAPEHYWKEALELNFHAVRRLGEAAAVAMIETGWGRIVNITGSSEPRDAKNFGDIPGRSHINAANSAKAGVHAWTKGFSREVGGLGVTVNSVAPGTVVSEQVNRIHATEEERAAHIRTHIPVGRFGQPEDVANLVAYLASPLAGYITGELIHVDGGMRRYAF